MEKGVRNDRKLPVANREPLDECAKHDASVDSGLPVIYGRVDLKFVGCSDEHGVIEDPNGLLKINVQLRLVPGHCDPTCNMHDWYVGVRNGKVETVWPVSARGKAL